VRFSPSRLLSGDRVDLRAASGTGTIAVTEDTLTRAVQRHETGITITLASGRAVVHHPSLPRPVEVRIRVSGRALTITAGSAPQLPPITVPLPELVAGMRYTRARIEDSTLAVDFVLANQAVTI
jgi:hypothetical protein